MGKNLDILDMTDEEFSKLSAPPAIDPADVSDEEDPPDKEPKDKDENLDPDHNQENTQTDEEDPDDEDGAGEENDPEEGVDAQPEGEIDPAGSQEAPEPKKENPGAETDPEGKDPPDTEEKSEEKPDYEAFYKRIMAPFKANGKMIQLQSAEEVITLMQQGANYTKKMQALQPYKKLLMMLEANNLLDENKLSFLIDLDKKNPEAIRKLLKDSNIDPIDIDTSAEVKYKEGAHVVSDREAALQQVIEDIEMMPGGKETLQAIKTTWDDASKQELWRNPSLLSIIHSQRDNGIYDRITTEMERLKTLGRIHPSIPFLQAYKLVGDALQAAGAFNDIARPAAQAQPPAARVPVATRPAKTPAVPKVDNRVRAAAPPRNAPSKQTQEKINPLAMDDTEFMKRVEELSKRL